MKRNYTWSNFEIACILHHFSPDVKTQISINKHILTKLWMIFNISQINHFHTESIQMPWKKKPLEFDHEILFSISLKQVTQWDIQENKEIWTRSKLQQGQVRNNYVFNIRFRSVDTRPPTCSLNYSQGRDRWSKGIELYSILSPFIIIQLTEWLIFFLG